jgi:hypothetical protein
MKTLTRNEGKEFIKSLFREWHLEAIKILMTIPKFKELLLALDSAQKPL